MAFQPLAHLHVRQLMNGRKFVMLAVLVLMPLAITLLYQSGGGYGETGELAEWWNLQFLYMIYVWGTGLLISLIYGTSIMHAEIEGKTITYLFTRPVPKWKIVVAKYVATVGFVGLPLLCSLFLAWATLGMPGGLAGIIVLVLQLAVGIVAWVGVFAAIGVIVPKHPVPVGIVYALVVEVACTWIPAVVNQLTVAYYQRSIMFGLLNTATQMPNAIGRIIGNAPVWVALLVPAAIGAAGVGLACYVTQQRQFIETQVQAGA